jgi:hypothetical protein
MSDHDPLDLLRRANPVREEDVRGPDSAEGQALLERIVATPPGAARRWGRWLRRRRVLVLVPIAVLGLAAAAYVALRPVEDPGTIACYREASLQTGDIVVRAPAGDPVAACRTLWEPGGEFVTEDGVVPPLTACVLDSGILAVFPGEASVCQALGLAVPDPDPGVAEENRRIVELEEALVARFLGQCLPEAEAMEIIVNELERRRFGDWRVETRGEFSEARPCASLGFDPANRVVLLIPVPR